MPATAERVFLDTNVLLAASDRSRELHPSCLRLLHDLPGRGVTCCLSGQVLREYVAVATRPVDANGLGMDREEAIANARHFREGCRLLPEDGRASDRWFGLLERCALAGKQVHDAQVAATMTANGVDTLITADARHYAALAEVAGIAIVEPSIAVERLLR